MLQTPQVFINVSQVLWWFLSLLLAIHLREGTYAKKEELKAAFETDDIEAIIKIVRASCFRFFFFMLMS